MKYRLLISKLAGAVCVILAAAMVVCGCSLFDYGDDEGDVPLATPLSVEYTMYNVIKGDIVKTIDGTCTITSFGAVPHCFTVDGYQMKKIYVKNGAKVEKGDTLAELSDPTEKLSEKKRIITAEVSGTVRYINTKYTISSSADKTVNAGETIIVVDPENMSDAQGFWTKDASDFEKYSIGIGSTVTLWKTVAGGDKISFEGEIVGSNEYDDNQTGSRTYYIDLSNAPDTVSVGDRLSVSFTDSEQALDCLKIPLKALYSFGDKSFVYVLDSQGLKRECYVEVGISNGTFVEIKSGLELGDQIIEY